MISGSSAGRIIGCPASEALPHVHTTTLAADRGTEIHAFIARCIDRPQQRDEALEAVSPEYRNTCAAIDVRAAIEGLAIVGTELSYALNVSTKTARLLGKDLNRNYGKLEPFEVPLTIDVVATSSDGTPVEIDWKSGRSIGEVDAHWQRRLSATALMFIFDSTSAYSRVGYIREDGTMTHDSAEFNYIDACSFCDTVVEAMERVAEAQRLIESRRLPTVYPSESNCNYCPAATYCPYQTGVVRALVGQLTWLENGVELLEPSQRGEAWAIAKRMAKVSEDVIAALKKMADLEPIALPDGKVVAPGEIEKSGFDAGAARGLLLKLGASSEDMSKLYRKYKTVEYRSRKVGK